MSGNAAAARAGRKRRPSRPITLAPDLMWALEQLAGTDGYLDVRTWIVARLREVVKARADELPDIAT